MSIALFATWLSPIHHNTVLIHSRTLTPPRTCTHTCSHHSKFKQEDLFYDYGKSIVVVLKSRKSNSVCCACLFTVHSTGAGDAFEMIWFATRAKKQRLGLGMCLFRRVCQACKAYGAKGLVITANDNVACWWMSLGQDVRALTFHAHVVRSGKSPEGIRRSAEPGHDKRMSKVPSFTSSGAPDGIIAGFYATPSGKPFRYDINNTTHVWFLPASMLAGAGANKGKLSNNGNGGGKGGSARGSSSNNKGGSGSGDKKKRNSSNKYAVAPGVNPSGRKRKSFHTAGVSAQALVRFDRGGNSGAMRKSRWAKAKAGR